MDTIKDIRRTDEYREIYLSKIESIHLSAIFRKALVDELEWEEPVISSSYFESMGRAVELIDAKVLEVEYLDGVFDLPITRVTEKGRHLGHYFRITVFKGYDIAFLYGFDYVGDEINLYAAKSVDKFAEFFAAAKQLYKDHTRKDNTGKITVYTVEHGNPKTYSVPLVPVHKADMVCDPEILDSINTDLSTFFVDKSLFEKFDITYRRGVLLHGPPGCGKTMMVKYIATISKVPVVQFFASNGCDTGDLIKFFDYIGSITPAIVIFEDLDSLFKGDLARSNFLNILDGACTDKQLPLLILATTNHIKEIDEALTQRPSRFDRQYFFDYPSAALRKEYILQRFRNLKDLVEDENVVTQFVANTDKLSYSHLNEIYTQAALIAIKSNAEHITLAFINEAIKNVKKETGTQKGKLGLLTSTLVPLKKGVTVFEEDEDY